MYIRKEIVMSIRCSKCGSKNIDYSENNEGYDIKKGAVGVALFGTGGAAMGINGNSKRIYHCKDCGAMLPYPMSEFNASKIDEYLASPAIYRTLLDMEKKFYPNIEWESTTQKAKKYKTNDELADDWIKYITDTHINVFPEKKVEELFRCV